MKGYGFFLILAICIQFCHLKFLNKNDVEFSVSYAKWRKIKSIFIINKSIKEYSTKLYKNFSKNGIYLALIKNSTALLQKFENGFNTTKKTAIVLDFEHQENETIENVMKLMPKLEISWVFLMKSPKTSLIDDLKQLEIALNIDLVIVIRSDPTGKRIKIDKKLINFFDTSIGNCLLTSKNNQSNFCLQQIYKIRPEFNESLILNNLGIWNSINGTKLLKTFKTVEQRVDLLRYPIKIGIKSSDQQSLDVMDENAVEDDDEEDLYKVLEYITNFLNASPEIFSYSKWGQKDINTGEWSYLLKAVVDEGVDFALGNVVQTEERASDMAFTFIIMRSMRNIYIKPQISNELRDIFLIPFGPKLILSVVCTGLLLATIVAIISYIQKYENFGIGDTIIWCVGIFSMQGSIWSPKSLSGNVILIISLLFALVIYNSYQAFITSVLSVEIANIRSIADLLESNYEIGYAKNSPDEIFLRFVNDTQLQQIYLRGYLQNNVNNITEGLLKAAEGNYGFFASKHRARKQLWAINNYRCNYDISEIPIDSTIYETAFPISKNSPLRRVINLSIIRMYETGIIKYIKSLQTPQLPKCQKKRKFLSAQLPDLMTAFGLLILGGILSIFLLIIECLWMKKKKIYLIMKEKILN